MIVHKAAALIPVLACALALGACDHDVNAGPVRTETRNVGDFESIDLDGTARIEIRVGEPVSVVVAGRRGAIERVQTDVRDGTLRIDSKPRRWFTGGGRSRVTLKIALPHLESLRVEGGNDVRLSGFDGGESSIDATGAVHITGKGRLDQLTVRLAGAGRADLSELIANEANVTVDGVGSVVVSPRNKLNATMNGVGAIYYIGSPRNVSTRMNGLGTISRRDRKGPDADDPAGERDSWPDDEQRDSDTADDSTVVI